MTLAYILHMLGTEKLFCAYPCHHHTGDKWDFTASSLGLCIFQKDLIQLEVKYEMSYSISQQLLDTF